MWTTENLGLSKIDDILVDAFSSAGVQLDRSRKWPPPFEQFRRRVRTSYTTVLAMKVEVARYFDMNPPPQSSKIAIFASGSAARLELYCETSGQIPTEIPTEPALVPMKERKESESDLDLLCIIDGGDPRRRVWKTYMKGLTDHLLKCGIPLDSPSLPPEGGFRVRWHLAGKARDRSLIRQLRRESKIFETLRYWIVFESVLLYAYPTGQIGLSFAEELEAILARDYFGSDWSLELRAFPLLWFHAACRYMSGIYLDTLRGLIWKPRTIDDEQSIASGKMLKAVKLRSVRTLAWCVMAMNALIAHQMTKLGLSEDELSSIWSDARMPGIIPSFRLQQTFDERIQAIGRIPGSGPVNVTGEGVRELERIYSACQAWNKKLAQLRRELIRSYVLYFEWLEREEKFPQRLSISDVNKFIYGAPVETLELSEELIKLVECSSRLFGELSQRSLEMTGYSPMFPFR